MGGDLWALMSPYIKYHIVCMNLYSIVINIPLWTTHYVWDNSQTVKLRSDTPLTLRGKCVPTRLPPVLESQAFVSLGNVDDWTWKLNYKVLILEEDLWGLMFPYIRSHFGHLNIYSFVINIPLWTTYCARCDSQNIELHTLTWLACCHVKYPQKTKGWRLSAYTPITHYGFSCLHVSCL